MPLGGFAHAALKQKRLIGHFQRVAVREINLELRRAFLVRQRVDGEILRFGEAINIVDDRIEFVDGVDRKRLAGKLGPAGLAGRRAQRVVGIVVARGEIKLQFGGDDRTPALFLISAQDAL